MANSDGRAVSGTVVDLQVDLRGTQVHTTGVVMSADDEEWSIQTPNGRTLSIPSARIIKWTAVPASAHRTPRQHRGGRGKRSQNVGRVNEGAKQPAKSEPNSRGERKKRHRQQSSNAKSIVAQIQVERNKIRDDGSLSAQLIKENTTGLHRASQALDNAITQGLARDGLRIAQTIASRIATEDLAAAASARAAYLANLKEAGRVRKEARQVTFDVRREIADFMRELGLAEGRQWEALQSSNAGTPFIDTNETLVLTPSPSGEVEVPIRVSVQGERPAKSVRVRLEQFRGLSPLGQASTVEAIHPGSAQTLTIRMRNTRNQGAKGETRVKAHLIYVDAFGKEITTASQTLKVQLRDSHEHEPIQNPFRAYAGGIPVENPDMFFGRQDLISDLGSSLLSERSGICWAIYGQKRSGKSSVLEQVKRQVMHKGALVAQISMGTIDRVGMTAGFVEDALDQLRVQAEERASSGLSRQLLQRWPDQDAILKQPLRSFRMARTATRATIRATEGISPPIVLVVDEFTYLFEVLRRHQDLNAEDHELRDFMRQWKGLLEARLFSALVVGQDTMPAFLAAFPNEFSVIRTRRLDYLSAEETQSLADAPTRNADGSSRFGGYALSSLADFTGGHPFFTQILCDRLVERANVAKRFEFTQADVEEAVASLIDGSDQLEPHKFDCFLTADNAGATISEWDAGATLDPVRVERVLGRMARIAGSQNVPVHRDSLELTGMEHSIVNDLIARGVVKRLEGDRLQVRVLLYADYLRRTLS